MNIETPYQGGIITYRESTNTWHAHMDGAELTTRGVSSLAAARKVIEDTVNGETKEKFTPVPAVKLEYGHPIFVEVTSPCPDGDFWIRRPNPEGGRPTREKARPYQLFMNNPENCDKLRQIATLRDEELSRAKQRDALTGSLQRFALGN